MTGEQDRRGMLGVIMRNRYPGAPDHDEPTIANPTTIEQALTEMFLILSDEDYIDAHITEPVAVELARVAMTVPEMQAIARQAAIGAAVERISAGDRHVALNRWPNGKWTVITTTVGAATGWGGPSNTLPEAIAAALGEDDE